MEHANQRPIFYIRRSLVDAETHYRAMEKLALVVVVEARSYELHFSHTR